MSHCKVQVGQIGQTLVSRKKCDFKRFTGESCQFVFHRKTDLDAFERLVRGLDLELFITNELSVEGLIIFVNLPTDTILWVSCNESVRNFLGPKAKSTKLEPIKLLFSWSERKFFPLP